MLYHPRESKTAKFIKLASFWTSLVAMLWLIFLAFNDDIKIPRRQIISKIDLINKVNICLPEADKNTKESILNFD